MVFQLLSTIYYTEPAIEEPFPVIDPLGSTYNFVLGLCIFTVFFVIMLYIVKKRKYITV